MLNKFFFLMIPFVALPFCSTNGFSTKRTDIVYGYMNEYAKKVEKKGLKLAGLGGAINHDTGKQRLIKMVFEVNDLRNINCARRTIIETLDDFLNFINSKADFKNVADQFPFQVTNVRIAILSDNDKLTAVSNYKNKFYYRATNPDKQRMDDIQIHEETYEEAKAILAKEASQ